MILCFIQVVPLPVHSVLDSPSLGEHCRIISSSHETEPLRNQFLAHDSSYQTESHSIEEFFPTS